MWSIAIPLLRPGTRSRTCHLTSPSTTSHLIVSTLRISHVGTRSSSSFTTSSSPPSPLLKLENAHLTSLPSSQNPFDWTINDHSSSECWALISPSSEAGGSVRRELISILTGTLRPRLYPSNLQHPPPHPFLLEPTTISFSSSSDSHHHHHHHHQKPATKAIKHVSFATKIGSSSSSSGEFTNYSARYGAIRDQDRVTLYERLMDLLECPVGLVAAQRMLPDPFETTTADHIGLFKYKSDQERQSALIKAQNADGIIKRMAPLLLITDELLQRPVIALSNGQTRRARILSSLITGAELVVLEEPFSGIDKHTRHKLSHLFAELHGRRRPRLVLVLREQDDVPDLVTHTLRVNDQGEIVSLGPRSSSSSSSCSNSITNRDLVESKQGGLQLVKSNASSGVGIGNSSSLPVISLNRVSIAYGHKIVLDKIDLSIYPGQHLILAGDNGSGKTTLLALLLGDHPKSFSFPSEHLSLFGKARDHPSNARILLNRRMGHLSPELFNAFPRKSSAMGGLTVGEVVASGFEGVFARRQYDESQKRRVYSLLGLFVDLIKSPLSSNSSPSSSDTNSSVVMPQQEEKGLQGQEEIIKALSNKSFSELSNGSQAVVLFLRAVVSNPSLLVLDEPFQGMDKKQVQRTTDYIDHPHRFALGNTQQERNRDIQQRKNMAIVLVSHYESEWPKSFGSLLRLSDGKVVQRI
ncbi:related to ABC transporter family members [Melanopsichium pennsylvanicum]|uniref:Related to ABC transporter family members n=1 Tax=Melanopsichium pennsylvanicum TaxID=63383 RepID=A0AAJ4XMP4_9BASI|nr:related to ABC transporter family members [Melanopsichium pennsylvanicum]